MKDPKATDVSIFNSSTIAHAHLASIIECSYDAIISKNLDGTITSWNKAAEGIFGYSAAEAVGRHISLIIPEDRLDEEAHIISQLRAGHKIDHFETVRRRKDGQPIDLSITVSPIRNERGKVVGASKIARDITGQKAMEVQLRKSKEDLEARVSERTAALEKQRAFLEAILDNINDAIVACDENGVLSLFNRATVEIHGLPSEPVPSEQWAEHYRLFMPDSITPMKQEDVPLFKALKEGVVRDVEMVIAPRGKPARSLLASGQALVAKDGKKFGAVVSMHDITERKKQERALIETQTFLRAVLDTVADPIFVKDENHCWIEGNTAFWNLLGSEEEVKGKTDYDLFPKEQADLFWEGDNKVFESGGAYDAEERLRGQDGNDMIIMTRKMAFTLPNGQKALVGIVRDITQQRELEKELRLHREKMQELVHIQTKELKKAKDKAEAASFAKGEFLANMSHEIRTPMSAVIGIANILSEEGASVERQGDLLQTLGASAHQLMALINDLLDVSKIEDSSFSLSSVPFDLKEVIREAISINRIEAQNKKISLECVYKSRLSAQFMGDPVRLRQVIINLVGNAVKFTNKGGVTIELEATSISEDGIVALQIDVKDTGMGIPKEKLDTIFGRFVQADEIGMKYGGSGLGLSISKQLAEMMGGNISVQSEVGAGTCFTVSLPLKIAGEPMAVTEKIDQVQTPVAGQNRKPCVLLVEDYEPNILVTGTLLETFGYDCTVARNGDAALKRLEEGGVDAVLMDVQMPGMDGFTATCLWREKEAAEHLPRVPIIGMTAHALQGDRKRCEDAGMDDYVSKPFDITDLKSRLRSHIKAA